MKKFECNTCGIRICTADYHSSSKIPLNCTAGDTISYWHEVKEDSAKTEQFGNSEQLPKLPDWVKVGEPVYNIEKKQYQTISLINGTVICKDIDSEGCTQYGYGAFMSDCVEARKRPFNEAEMKALVGKVVKNKEDNLMLVTMFYPKSGGQIKFCNMWYTAKDLMKNSYTVDGKPCYKLKHMNDKGEWVE